MAYKCERNIIREGEETTIDQCETCRHEKLASAEWPCSECSNNELYCPLYGPGVDETACEIGKWEEIGHTGEAEA